MNLKLVRILDYYAGIPVIQFLRIFRLFRKYNKPKPKKILIMKFFGIGNLVMSSPILYSIKKKFPEAKIHYLTLNSNRGILECYKEYVSKPVYLDIGNINFPIATLRLLFGLRREKYDILLDLDQFSRYSAIVSFLLKPKFSIGYKTKGAMRHYLYDSTVKYLGDKHVAEEFLNPLLQFGIKPEARIRLLPLKTTAEAKNKLEKWLLENKLKNKKLIGMHTGVGENAPQKKWPFFRQLIEKILKNTDCCIVLTAGPAEYNDCDKLISKLAVSSIFKERVKVTKGIKLDELPFLMEQFKIFISNDTGPLHMAAAQGIYVIGLYGPATPKVYGPHTQKKQIFYKPLKCSPCITNFNNKETKCDFNRCMRLIQADDVFDAVMRLL